MLHGYQLKLRLELLRPTTPHDNFTSTSTVGLPRESSIWRAFTSSINVGIFISPFFLFSFLHLCFHFFMPILSHKIFFIQFFFYFLYNGLRASTNWLYSPTWIDFTNFINQVQLKLFSSCFLFQVLYNGLRASVHWLHSPTWIDFRMLKALKFN